MGKSINQVAALLAVALRMHTTRTSPPNNSGPSPSPASEADEKLQLAGNACESHHWLVVLGIGRSGSTTILSMLNRLPNVRLSGENNGVLSTLQAVNSRYSSNGAYASDDPSHPWYRVKPKTFQSYLCSLVASMAPHAGNEHIRGFKEIRWNASLAPALDLLPRVRFVLSYRLDVLPQTKSGYYKKMLARYNSSSAISLLQTRTQELLQAVQGTRCPYFLLPLESFSSRTFNELLAWLGFDDCRYTFVLHVENSDGGHKGDPRTRDPKLVEGKCEFAPSRWPSSSHTAVRIERFWSPSAEAGAAAAGGAGANATSANATSANATSANADYRDDALETLVGEDLLAPQTVDGAGFDPP